MKNGSVLSPRGIVRKFFSTLSNQGPLVAAKRANEYMQERHGKTPGSGRIFLSIDRCFNAIQLYLDGSFDRKYGVETSGIVPLQNLTIQSEYDHIKEGIWYEPMSVKIFHQIMSHLRIDFTKYEFIDFGSGKGRVLLLASEYGFLKVIGVEFARELHAVAKKNVDIYNGFKKKLNKIETLCIDATRFSLPNSPLVLFFYSPFRSLIMKRVLENLSNSLTLHPRNIMLIFYGLNPDTIDIIKSMGFQWKEMELRSDWTRGTQYRCFLFSNLQSGRDHHE